VCSSDLLQPVVDMNPVLLKPQSETGSQIIVQGVAQGSADARAYHDLKPTLMPAVRESYDRLSRQADLVLIEGAGSPAEVNLRRGDIANMGFATAADVPVVLVGDIERGGVIASLVGTAALLAPDERARVKGYIINKFRGDPSLFDGAHPIINQRTGWESLGIVPWLDAARELPDEDAVALDDQALDSAAPRAIKIAVPRLSRIANFDDLDPLRAEPDVSVIMVPAGEALPGDADLADHLARYRDVDIALDPFPCNGGTTSLEALWMGVPVVTMAGETFMSRQGLTFLGLLGLDDLVAMDADSYLDAARRLAGDTGRLLALRRDLRQQVETRLLDPLEHVAELETSYDEMWRRHDAGERPAAFSVTNREVIE